MISSNEKYKGFSLIELMIVVAIVGILASIAYPSYQSFMTDGYRGSAQADMLAFAAAMERHHSVCRCNQLPAKSNTRK